MTPPGGFPGGLLGAKGLPGFSCFAFEQYYYTGQEQRRQQESQEQPVI